MSENGNIAVPGQLEIRITMDMRTGAVNVNGPFANKVIFLGLLEIAKKVVHDFDQSKAIVQAAQVPKIVQQ